MMTLLLVVLAISVNVVVHTLSMAAAARLAGQPVEKIGIFTGPRIRRINVGNVVLDVNSIPITGSVRFGGDLQTIHPLKLALISFGGNLTLFILAAVALGPSEALHKFLMGFPQIVSGAIAPHSSGTSLLVALQEFASANPFAAVLGLAASKMAAWNLLPIPNLNGGVIVLVFVHWLKPMSQRVRERLQLVGLVLILMIMVGWFLASCFFFWSAPV
ncbi:MAG: hypothetical protein GY851_24605 [bacterium]|nr:hypothetical protein [bacterium]